MKLKDFRYDVDYTWVKTKTKDTEGKTYDLLDPAQRRLYFNAKIGEELELLREFLKNNTFIAYLLAPKLAGKGTYTNLLIEAVGAEYFEAVGVGDLARAAKAEFTKNGKDSDLYKYMEENYRGMLNLDEAFDALMGSGQKTLIPSEFILSLIKKRIDEIGRKTIFLDGFPRKADQLTYSLYFRDLVDYREDPDFFVLINLPLSVIDARLKGRRMCPECRSSRNLSLFPTKNVQYDQDNDRFYLVCDNPNCQKIRLEAKEGDKEGIRAIQKRISDDLELMKMARKMYGIPKIELYNSLEKSKAFMYVDKYEITQKYIHTHEGEDIVTETEPFIVEEDGQEYYSLLPAPVIIQYIRQLCYLFRLE
jgi:adenylate kinase family enzyme